MFKKGLLFAVMLTMLTGCGVASTIWKSIKDTYKPYEFLGTDGDKVLVKFVFDSPSSTSVWLAGAFNNWASSASAPKYPEASLDVSPIIPMTIDATTGYWTVTLALKPGRYQYKYVLDAGRVWAPDPNTEHVDDNYGGFNSIIVVIAPNE